MNLAARRPRSHGHLEADLGAEDWTAQAARYEARHVKKSFGGALALSDVSVSFEPGEIHTLCGENGAGKSTLFKVMAGIHQPDQGEILLGGEVLPALNPRSAQQRGIYLVPQEPTLMATLSAFENLFVGILPRGRLPFSVDWKQMERSAGAFFAQVGLDIDPHVPASALSSSCSSARGHWPTAATSSSSTSRRRP
jgi:ABC-type sugar transport system ATPase subunit